MHSQPNLPQSHRRFLDDPTRANSIFQHPGSAHSAPKCQVKSQGMGEAEAGFVLRVSQSSPEQPKWQQHMETWRLHMSPRQVAPSTEQPMEWLQRIRSGWRPGPPRPPHSPRAVQVHLARVQLHIFLLLEDSADHRPQDLVKVAHAHELGAGATRSG